ncbi:MAG: hypothetical protein HW380_894 [Magnetococcales bacterium]|nr:hypothetical protein [Magnetococcales bacterium]HIJ84779.1 TIGR02281 family clan AA aspartic protease [Magnetococcales bacterium]
MAVPTPSLSTMNNQGMRRGQRFIVIWIVLALLVLWLQWIVTGGLWDGLGQEKIASALFSMGLLSWMLSWSRWRGAFTLFKWTAPWLVLLLVLFSGYVFRAELSGVGQRLRAAFLPHSGVESQPGRMHFVRSNDGHFYIHAQINGRGVRFLADTGASDIILDRKTAARVGVAMERLDFSKVYNTANGRVRGAPVRLENFKVGSLELHNLPASVNDAPMDQPLLGMSFFNRLRGFEVHNDVLTIQWTSP